MKYDPKKLTYGDALRISTANRPSPSKSEAYSMSPAS